MRLQIRNNTCTIEQCGIALLHKCKIYCMVYFTKFMEQKNLHNCEILYNFASEIRDDSDNK